MSVRFGADRVVLDPTLLGSAKRVGLVTNDAARLAADASLPSRLALRDAGVPLVRLFSAEHGLSLKAEDGAPVADGIDPLTKLPVVSLYGEQLRPAEELLRDLDVVVFDIPDIGSRFYSYIWTLFQVMGACADAGVPLIVLDRPNPLGGRLDAAEGPMLALRFSSFIGGDSIPVRHSLTVGELSRLWQRDRFPRASVRVVECEGWRREMLWGDTVLPFVQTSPSIASFESALLYPGICLFEATNLSVGRGTDIPFRRIGAPWLDASRVLQHLSRQTPRGARFDTEHFTAVSVLYAGEPCTGVRITVTDARILRPVSLGLLLLAAVIATHQMRFAWWRYPTVVNPEGFGHFERLVGRVDIRTRLDSSADGVDGEVVEGWTNTDGWGERVKGMLLYD